ncbi:MAG: biotin--[acetyl-CoA-carboxylase] ligase [Cellulosilyticum sp.]|nr:biotin--[acetyl-CoA-carboxylase] ligase [Cellulosilyticum sp.]
MKDKVLAFLKKEKKYCSGEEISHELGVTRAAIWKTIKKLQAEGYEIQSSTKKGYKLLGTPNIVTPSEVKEHLQTKVLGQTIYYETEMDSTNNKAKELARQGAQEGTLVIADKQTNGKGRLGRSWTSPEGAGIWMSLILRPHILPQYASQITLVAGLSLCEAIQEVTGLEVGIKWPNDVVVNGKKVCGILTEMNAEMEEINYIIVGIGINVNIMTFPVELPYASSLRLEGGEEYSRSSIIQTFLEKFEVAYNTYKSNPTLESIRERYEKNCITLYKKVKLIKKNEEVIAYATGITNEGALSVCYEDDSKEDVLSGEISVRGLYGYV